MDRLSRDRREPPPPAARGRDQQPPHPADRQDRVEGRLALRRHSVERTEACARRLAPAADGPGPLDLPRRYDLALPFELGEQRLVDMPGPVRLHAREEADVAMA